MNSELRGKNYRSTEVSSMSSTLASMLLEIVAAPISIVEIGTSPGALLEGFQHSNLHTSKAGPDRPISVQSVTLAEELPDPPSASIAICLEGAETLPPQRALDLVQWLSKAADLVVFAAALPGQMGIDHIHCQPTLYWSDLFELCEFKRFDILRQHLLSNTNIPWQQRQNMVIYARLNSESERQLQLRYPHNFLPPEFELVHHTMITNAMLFRSAKSEPPSIGELVRFLPAAIKESIRCRVSSIGEKLSRLRYN